MRTPVHLLLQAVVLVNTYLGDLDTPIEEVLGADMILVLPDIFKEAAVWHQLSDQLYCGGQTNPQETTHIRASDSCHHIGLLRNRQKQGL